MLISSGTLLLIACAVVQALASTDRRRAALGTALGAGALHLVLAYAADLPLGAASLAAGAFYVACAVTLHAQRRAAHHVSALVALCDVDEATSCLNRRGFSARLDAAAERAVVTRAPLALLALDLDYFKDVNDRFGHLSGDAVLGEVSAALMQAVGAQGVVARLGGEEFAVLLPGSDPEAAGVLAERLLETVRRLPLQALPSSVRVTMSAGIAAERIHDVRTGDALRARADEALYAAKRSGRDRALLWAPGVHSHATPVRSIASVVRTSVTAPRFARR